VLKALEKRKEKKEEAQNTESIKVVGMKAYARNQKFSLF